MINRDSRGHPYSTVRGEILGFVEDELLRKHLTRMFSLISERKLGDRRRLRFGRLQPPSPGPWGPRHTRKLSGSRPGNLQPSSFRGPVYRLNAGGRTPPAGFVFNIVESAGVIHRPESTQIPS